MLGRRANEELKYRPWLYPTNAGVTQAKQTAFSNLNLETWITYEKDRGRRLTESFSRICLLTLRSGQRLFQKSSRSSCIFISGRASRSGTCSPGTKC